MRAELQKWVDLISKCHDKDDLDFLLEMADKEMKITAGEFFVLQLLVQKYKQEHKFELY